MKTNSLLPFFFFVFLWSAFLNAQDDYHQQLASTLMEDYGLPSGEWLFHDNELANESAFFNWGSQRSTNTIEGQEFTRETRAVVNQVCQNPWYAGLFMNNRVAIAPGEKVLWTFYMRAEGSEGQVSFIAERNSGNFDKEVSFTVPIDQNW
ncbi:MAG: hypothetical protein AAFQ37_11520, partial [Bacteroidota bacterium]